ncbi:MAG TPA: ABC transporter permease [Verrucomicrobiae bacterium]|nr:ABC transporter permease [Verrucomicrobiae bacterium]
MKGLVAIFIKECRENLRDRRSVTNALVWGPLLMPVMFLGQMMVVAKQARDVWEDPPSIAVFGAEYAPNLVAYLRREGAEIREAPEDATRAVRDQVEDAVMIVSSTFPEQWQQGEPAVVELVYDASRRRSESRHRRVRSLLEGYSRTVGNLRLIARGVEPGVMRPVQVVERDVSEGGIGGAVIASFLPFVLMFSAFLGGFYLAVDTTAGERERQSLEPLLANPVSRLAVVLGKLGATIAFSLAATLIGIVAFALCLLAAAKYAPLEAIGLHIGVPWHRWLALAALLLPVVMLASAAQTLVAAFSRTFREAQTYVQFLMFVPMVPCFIVLFNPVKPALLDMAIPFWSQTVLIDRLLRGEAVEPALALAAAGATTVAAMLVTLLVVKLYRGERLLFAG